MAKLSEFDEQSVAAMKEDSDLLDEFGLNLFGYTYHPAGGSLTAWFKQAESSLDTGGQIGRMYGMSGRGYSGEPIALNKMEWRWLKPLLLELLEYRRMLGPKK